MKVPERHRIISGSMKSDESYGNNGAFLIPMSARTSACVIVSDGEGWEHCSVHMRTDEMPRTPTWVEMCKIKDMFWDEEETVVQFHPPKSQYVNNHKFCLHLWKPTEFDIPTPPAILVGLIDQ